MMAAYVVPDVLAHIFRYLNALETLRCMYVCGRWRRLIIDRKLFDEAVKLRGHTWIPYNVRLILHEILPLDILIAVRSSCDNCLMRVSLRFRFTQYDTEQYVCRNCMNRQINLTFPSAIWFMRTGNLHILGDMLKERTNVEGDLYRELLSIEDQTDIYPMLLLLEKFQLPGADFMLGPIARYTYQKCKNKKVKAWYKKHNFH